MSHETVQDPPAVRLTPEADPDPILGSVIQQRFRVDSLIARGTSARTYRGLDLNAQQPCAIKLLELQPLSGIDPSELRQRFLLDTSAASRLTHPNTATVFASGTHDDLPFVAMELLQGRTLHRALREDGPFPEDRIVHVARQIARSVAEAHALGIVHRDLRPANVFLIDRDHQQDFVKVVDFGLLCQPDEATGRNLAREPAVFGSPRYLAPEQIRGERVDARTDVYAFGVILYELATGKVPFDAPAAERILQAQLEETPTPLRAVNSELNISAALEELILRCLQKDPDLRYASMEQILEALKVGGTSVATLSARPPGRGSAAIARPGARPQSSRPPSAKAQAPAGEQSEAPLAAGALTGGSGVVTSVLSEKQKQEARMVPQNLLALLGGAALVVGLAAVTAYAIKLAGSPAAAVRIESSPEGATVRSADGAILCESTPCAVQLGEQAQQGRTILVSRQGYKDESRLVRRSDATVVIKLTPLR